MINTTLLQANVLRLLEDLANMLDILVTPECIHQVVFDMGVIGHRGLTVTNQFSSKPNWMWWVMMW